MWRKVFEAFYNAISMGKEWGWIVGITIFLLLLFLKFNSSANTPTAQHRGFGTQNKVNRSDSGTHVIGCAIFAFLLLV